MHLTALGVGPTVVNGCVPPPKGVTAVPVTDLPPVRYWAVCRRQRLAMVADVLDRLGGGSGDGRDGRDGAGQDGAGR